MNDKLQEFLAEWNDGRDTVTVHTSGSTGKPKAMEVEKRRMLASAKMTCDFLGLKEGDTALLCMPLDYIAGKMMVVRSIERRMHLISVEPSNHPLKNLTEVPIFAAMVPSQVYETLKVERERKLFCQIQHVIIGGGAIDSELEKELVTIPNHIWHSYGMTETLSHIALRRIDEPYFRPLPGITVCQDENHCLVIDAPHLCTEILRTHDIVEIVHETKKQQDPILARKQQSHTNMFRILGRLDNVVCSGGIKIQIEEVEALLRPTFGNTIQLTSAPHPKFGEELIMLTTLPIDIEKLKACLSNPYWMPRRIVMVSSLPLTETGKPDRAKAKILAKNCKN